MVVGTAPTTSPKGPGKSPVPRQRGSPKGVARGVPNADQAGSVSHMCTQPEQRFLRPTALLLIGASSVPAIWHRFLTPSHAPFAHGSRTTAESISPVPPPPPRSEYRTGGPVASHLREPDARGAGRLPARHRARNAAPLGSKAEVDEGLRPGVVSFLGPAEADALLEAPTSRPGWAAVTMPSSPSRPASGSPSSSACAARTSTSAVAPTSVVWAKAARARRPSPSPWSARRARPSSLVWPGRVGRALRARGAGGTRSPGTVSTPFPMWLMM